MSEELKKQELTTNDVIGIVKDVVKDAMKDVMTVVVKIATDVEVLKTDVAVLKTDVAGLKSDMVAVKSDIAGMKTEMIGMKGDIKGLKTGITEVKTTLYEFIEFTKEHVPTKDEVREIVREEVQIAFKQERVDTKERAFEYTDRQTSTTRGELVSILKQEDQKVTKVTELLGQKNVFTESDVTTIARLPPFPKVV